MIWAIADMYVETLNLCECETWTKIIVNKGDIDIRDKIGIETWLVKQGLTISGIVTRMT